ncbi:MULTISPECIES: phage portal protein [Streptomyces]|uniref:Phage portal protein n=1 Tax=Streptomyces evansiae TaxID=3075535 RepID=A0ABU2QZQ7_9ACTN|nr:MULTISPECIES: phage portal protein [unclassified Streptomyces]MDT0409943.1 phage portal protein [Streptomyces sp. DSM 41979]MYQ59970.1 phage portal protein [Streptomyces sp. SID4926]SCE40747.1 phage portal protein, putative, A118 family [Streptomyces sp. DfronAA-171]
MPLPTGNVPWPPPQLSPALTLMDTWDTWWSGDVDRLEQLYGGGTGAGPDPRRHQFSGGVVGRIARWWWGTPTSPGERRTKLHVPLAGDICAGSADLLFSEPPTFTVDDEDTQARLDELTDEGMLSTLQTGAEIGSALGGVYLRPVVDTKISDHAWTDIVHADRAVPEFVWGRLSAVTFWSVVREEDGQVWRHLERHEPGFVQHGLYQGTRAKLGRAVPLEDVPATEGFAPLVGEFGEIETGYEGLDVSHVPNQTTRRWRRDAYLKDFGRSDLDGVEPLMDQLDETYSSWMRDIRIGKGRILVPEAYLESSGPGQGARWNPDREAFAGLNMLARADSGQQLTVAQFAIRVQEHRETAEDLVNQILRSAGYSGQTFGIGGDVAVTATEVVSKERRSMTTRGRKVLRWRPALAHHVEALLAVDRRVFGGASQPQRPTVEFADSVQESPLSLATTAETLRRAQAASTETLVRMTRPELDKDEVTVEVARIHREQGMSVPDPMQAGALP